MNNILCYFTIFALIGYICEVVYAALITGKFVNRGFLFGPYCPIYGFASVILIYMLRPLYNNLILLFLCSVILTSILEYFSGYILEKLFDKRWWDYSNESFNLNGYICLRFSIIWGFGCVFVARIILPIIDFMLRITPNIVEYIVCGVVIFSILIDFVVTVMSVMKLNKHLKQLDLLSENMRKSSELIGVTISKETVELKEKYESLLENLKKDDNIKRLIKAFPNIKTVNHQDSLKNVKVMIRQISEKHRDNIKKQEEKNTKRYEDTIIEGAEKPFAYGLCYSKMFILFFVGCVAGFVIETIWCLVVSGKFEIRTGLVWGPFIPVYGFGAIVITLCLYRLRKKRDLWIFIGSALIGGAFEYACSLFQELVFGTVSWEYSDTPLNIGGRTNIMYAFFWGILGLIWLKDLYPRMSKLIEKINKKLGTILVIVLTIFMLIDITVSSSAVLRQTERRQGVAPQNAYSVWIDKTFTDEFLKWIYPNMIPVDSK